MANHILLEARTNSHLDIPAFGKFDKDQLDEYISIFGKAVNWMVDHVLSVDVSALPDFEFIEEGDEVWDNDESNNWGQTLTSITPNSATMLFVHSDTGDELFFEYTRSN